jgi:hypothetical protein
MTGLFFVSTPAFSCKCLPTGSVKVEYDRAAAVFSGRVISVSVRKANEIARTVKIRVMKTLKGKTANILTYELATNCDYYFEAGKKYLVYAEKNSILNPQKGPGILRTSGCGRTERLEKAQEDIRTITGFNVETGAP